MRKGLTLVFAMLAMTATTFAADNSLGTWKLDVAKSTQPPGMSPVKTLTVVRKAIDGAVDTRVAGEREDGSKIESSYRAKYDGKEVTLKGSGLPYDTISLTQVDANTFTDHRAKKGTAYKGTGRFTVSKDGKSALLEVTGADADGKPFTMKAVFVKQ